MTVASKNQTINGDVETLRQIIAKQQGCEITYEDAELIGAGLLEFYELLATEGDDESAQ